MATLPQASSTTQDCCDSSLAASTSSCNSSADAGAPKTAEGLQEELVAMQQQVPCNLGSAATAGTEAATPGKATAGQPADAKASVHAGCAKASKVVSGTTAAAEQQEVAGSARMSQQADRADPPPAAASAVQYKFSQGPVCARCGSKGHLEAACRTHLCTSCNLHGHRTGTCRLACSRCGRLHAQLSPCAEVQCNMCKLFGHKLPECSRMQCVRCGLYGHMHR